MTESGARKRDTPDNEDFEGEGQESEQRPEEAPAEVTEGDEKGKDGPDERRKRSKRHEDDR